MSYSNILRLVNEAFRNGGLLIGSSDSNTVMLDTENDQIELDGIDVALGDQDLAVFGDGADVAVTWNGTYLQATSALNALWTAAPCKADPNYDSIVHEFFDDFNVLDTTSVWTVTEDDAACTQAISDAACGVLLLTNKASTDDNAQQIAGKGDTFLLAAGKTLWFEARIKVAAATEIDVVVGLVADGEDMTGVADNRFADGIGFFKSDGATTLQFGASKDGTDTGANTNVGTLGTDWITLGFKVDGVTSATPYVNGVAGTPITATFCDDEALTPIVMVRNGDGTTGQTIQVDYVKAVQLR